MQIAGSTANRKKRGAATSRRDEARGKTPQVNGGSRELGMIRADPSTAAESQNAHDAVRPNQAAAAPSDRVVARKRAA